MTTIGSVEDYDELRGLSAGGFDIVLVRQQKTSAYTIPLSSPPNGGIFVWDENSTETENHGTIIVPKVTRPNGNGRWKRKFEDALSVKWFGAKGDMKEYYNVKDKDIKKHYLGNIVKDSDNLYLTSSDALKGFSDYDKDKIIVIWTDEVHFITSINKFVDDKNVVLADIAPKNMSGAYVAWGTDDTDAIQHAIDVAKETGFTVYLPPGHFIITSTLSYNTYQDMTEVRGIVVPQETTIDSPYSLMKHGLQILGAGSQVSFIHNLIKEGGATIRIDGAYPDLAFSFQQTGLLKDFNITSIGNIPKTIGIDMRATWAYTIQNIHVMKMGSHGIVFHNNYFKSGTSDGDACHALHLDNVFIYLNGGWGIIVDAGLHGLSTGKIYIERCWMEQNQKGGIQWAGQIGVIERCGFYGNGVFPKGTKDPTNSAVILDIPTPVPDAYGILIKNVKGTSDNLLVSGCEIQGNADVQVMVEVGANIKIIQNEFKVDDLSPRYTFPSIDIQVGDGNMGDANTDYLNVIDAEIMKIKLDIANPTPIVLHPTDYDHKIIELSGTGPEVTALSFPLTDGKEWLVVNNSNKGMKYGAEGTDPKTWRSVASYSQKSIHVTKDDWDKLVLAEYFPRTVNACVIEDNRIRVNWKNGWGKYKNPDEAETNKPKHTVVKVNTNAVGTVIGRWWTDQV